MSSAIVASLITGGFSVVGVIIANFASSKKISDNIKTELVTNQAVTDEKISELTREVREHNNFARRMPVVEEKIDNLENRVNKIESRLNNERNN